MKLIGFYRETLFLLFTNFELEYLPVRGICELREGFNFDSIKTIPNIRNIPSGGNLQDYDTLFAFVNKESNSLIILDGLTPTLRTLSEMMWKYEDIPTINKFFMFNGSAMVLFFTNRKSLFSWVGTPGRWMRILEGDVANRQILPSSEIFELNGSKITDFDEKNGNVILANGEILRFVEKNSLIRGIHLKESTIHVIISNDSECSCWGYYL